MANATGLNGVIRDSFASFRNLRFVDLSKNAFTGPMPGSIFGNSALEILYLYENALTGAIPASFAVAPNLRDLYVSSNKLTGTIPSIAPGQLAKLTELLLEGNAITGTMPASVCALRGDNVGSDLVVLVSDCGGTTPAIQCDCCTSCA